MLQRLSNKTLPVDLSFLKPTSDSTTVMGRTRVPGRRGNKPDGTEATLTLDTMGVALIGAALKCRQPLVALYPRVNYNGEASYIRPGEFVLYLEKLVQVEKGKLVKLRSEVVA